MEISYLGHSSFKLKCKDAILVTDPFDPEYIGLKFPKTTADIVTISHSHKDHSFMHNVDGNPLFIDGPGEYEVKGVKIMGVSTFHDKVHGAERGENTIYRIWMDGVSIVHCGDLGHKIEERLLELLDGVDVIMVPVGGMYTIDASTASEVASQLESKIIIPMHYNVPGLKVTGLTDVSVFLKHLGKENIIPIPKLTISHDRLPTETQVVVLE